MKKHLIYKDDKSDKFWSIEVNGSSFTVTYGKTGTAGTTQTKTFRSDYECGNEAEELIREKLKEEYKEGREVTAQESNVAIDFVKESEDIMKAEISSLYNSFNAFLKSKKFEELKHSYGITYR